MPCNRQRLHDEEQLAVKFSSYPDPDEYVDDFFFGYLIAASGKDRERILKEAKRPGFTFKRDSVLRMNLAKALAPYRHNAVFTQSPLSVEGSAYQNATSSALLHRETAVTAFQYPFALNLNDCKAKVDWTKKLLKAIGELNGVSGNHARSYYEMAPASIVVRLSESLVAGYGTYGFTQDGDFPEVIQGLLHEVDGKPQPDYPPVEFYIGGKIVKDMADDRIQRLRKLGVTLERDPRRLLEIVGEKAFGG